MTRLSALAALMAFVVLATAAPVRADDDWSFSISLGGGFAPDYEGADDFQPLPLGAIRIAKGNRYATLRGPELRVNVIDSKVWNFGPLLSYDFGRDGADDALVDRLRDVDPSLELGAFVSYSLLNAADPRYGLTLGLEVGQDVIDGHGGLTVRASTTYRKPFGDKFVATLGGSLGYATDSYMDAFFGIDANNAARSGLRQYDAEGALKDGQVNGSLTYLFTRNWSLTGLLAYTRLLADAADSPIVADRGSVNQLFGGLLASYRF